MYLNECVDCGCASIVYNHGEATCTGCGLVLQDRMMDDSIFCEDYDFSHKAYDAARSVSCLDVAKVGYLTHRFNLTNDQVDDIRTMYSVYKKHVKKDHHQLYVLLAMIYYLLGSKLTFQEISDKIDEQLNEKRFYKKLTTVKDALSSQPSFMKYLATNKLDTSKFISMIQKLSYVDKVTQQQYFKCMNKIYTKLSSNKAIEMKLMQSFDTHVIYVGILYVTTKILKHRDMYNMTSFARTFGTSQPTIFRVEEALTQHLRRK